MSLVSKTVLQQMRFVSKGKPFCNITAKTSITDTSDFYRQGDSFFGVSTEITPPTYSYSIKPVRQGSPLNIVDLKQLKYGGVNKGQPIFKQSTVTYTPYALKPVRQGANFLEITAKPSIDASSDFCRRGSPFYVKYLGTVVTFDATKMFLIF